MARTLIYCEPSASVWCVLTIEHTEQSALIDSRREMARLAAVVAAVCQGNRKFEHERHLRAEHARCKSDEENIENGSYRIERCVTAAAACGCG